MGRAFVADLTTPCQVSLPVQPLDSLIRVWYINNMARYSTYKHDLVEASWEDAKAESAYEEYYEDINQLEAETRDTVDPTQGGNQ